MVIPPQALQSQHEANCSYQQAWGVKSTYISECKQMIDIDYWK